MLKTLEWRWKSLCFSFLFACLRIRRAPEPPDWGSGTRRILFLRPDGIGDALVSTPLLRALRRISPDVHVDVLGSPANAPLLRELDFVRKVFVFDKRERGSLPALAWRLRRERYDAVIDPRVIAPSMTGLMLMLATGAPHRMGVGNRGADAGLTTVVPYSRGPIMELLGGFASVFGVDPKELDDHPIATLTDADREWATYVWSTADGTAESPRLLVNVSAGEAPRTWPDDNFVSTIRSLRQAQPDLRVILIAAPGELERGERIAASTGVPFVATATLGRVNGLVAEADAVFTPDTSIVHIASAFRKPTVAMYLRDTAWQWGAYGVPGANIEAEDGTLASLPPGRIVAELRRLLNVSAPSPLRTESNQRADEQGSASDV